ncbi:hypothetical protein NMY22_g3870 [Coprinellus aureogranulatus]|nr:hypothetical protein NMY22_g3870 [Coprinellus aureogranulatus]
MTSSSLPPLCSTLAVRKEWRNLSVATRLDYIRAVKCLQTSPRLDSTLASKFTRHDEFVISHMNVADQVHGVGQFLPWHRHFGFLYERDVCDYNGPFPYWDWTLDADGTTPSIPQSPIFDPVTGFGGDGVEGTYTPPTDGDGSVFPIVPETWKGCVGTGPFADAVMHVGPGKRFEDHCLDRKLSDNFRAQFTTSSIISNILSQTTYDNFWNSLDGFPFKTDFRLHDSGHSTLGGDMTSFYTSPNDPVFYPHHAGLDRIWWKWQNADLGNRLYEMGGKVNSFPPYDEVTLDYELPFAGFSPSVKIRKVMDLRREPYCYTYAD